MSLNSSARLEACFQRDANLAAVGLLGVGNCLLDRVQRGFVEGATQTASEA